MTDARRAFSACRGRSNATSATNGVQRTEMEGSAQAHWGGPSFRTSSAMTFATRITGKVFVQRNAGALGGWLADAPRLRPVAARDAARARAHGRYPVASVVSNRPVDPR